MAILRDRAVSPGATWDSAGEEWGAEIAKQIAAAGKNRRARQDVIRKLTPQAMASEITKKFDEKLQAALAQSSGGFIAFLDDTDFVVYSAGMNRDRDWARSVGQNGTDILVWPPLLTLLRENVAAKNIDPAALVGRWCEYDPQYVAPAPPKAEEGPDSPQRRRGGGAPTL